MPSITGDWDNYPEMYKDKDNVESAANSIPQLFKEKYIDPKKVKLIDLVKDNQMVTFVYFRDEEFWYSCENGFLFPISIAEATNSKVTFLAKDKAILFMRWIRKYIEKCKKEDS